MPSVIKTLSQLVRINSVNPAFPGGKGEGRIAGFIRRFFQKQGVEVWMQEVLPGRCNLIARLPGRRPGRRVLLEAHADTASALNMTVPPFQPTVSGGRLYGRGACDTKAGLAAMMEALVSIHKEGLTPPCEVWLAATIDEEYAMKGISGLCEGLEATCAVVAEPTELRVVNASKGCVRWRIHSRGRSAHSSKPCIGVNAISNMSYVIQAIDAHSRELGGRRHPSLGPPTCNIGVIQGGLQSNFVPQSCVIELDRRSLPGETVPLMMAQYAELLEKVKSNCPSLDYSMEPPRFQMDPLDTPADAPPVRLASQVLTDMGLNPLPMGVPFGSHASCLSACGIATIVLGPGCIDQAHSEDEFVECDQVEQAFEFYRRFALTFD